MTLVRLLIGVVFICIGLFAGLGARPAAAAEVTLAWDPNSETDLAGYRVFWGQESGVYQWTVDVGDQTHYPLADLEAGRDYYFAVKAYNTQGYESDFSEELHYKVPEIDSDWDGILDNNEISLYGTDPQNPDSDGDGLSDGEELALWGENWSTDFDGDGLNNLLDADSDNDGFSDGLEFSQGYDPADAASNQTILYWTDYLLTMTLRSEDNDALGVMFRYQDPQNYYRFSWNKQNYTRRLVKCEEGVFSLLAQDYVTYQQGRSYALQVLADGDRLQVSVDDNPIFDVVDGSFAKGGVALYTWMNAGSFFDDLIVEDLASGAVILSEPFDGVPAGGYTVVDQGTYYGPSRWYVNGGELVQSSDIYGGSYLFLDQPGTFAILGEQYR
jgi:hypothetical protein